MIKTTEHLRVLGHWFGAACIAALAAGCTANLDPPSDPPPDDVAMDVDPTGNWDLTYMLSDGCGEPASAEMTTFTVTRTAQGYAVLTDAGTITGTLLCTPDNCKLSGVLASSDSSIQEQENMNMTLNTKNVITGNGTISIVDVVDPTMNCRITFTVTGTKS